MTSKFSTQSILETIATYVKEGTTLEDVQNNAFYENAPIHDSEEATKEFESLPNGKLGAIQRVRDFETAVCGEVCTDLSNPVSVANMLIFINSQTIMAKLAEKMGIGLDYELTKQQAAQLSNVDTMKKLLFNSNKKEKETNIMSQQFNTQAVLDSVSTTSSDNAIMFKYEGYTDYMFGGIILTFSKDGNKYTMLNQQWDDDLDIDAAGDEIAYYLSDGEWNTDDLILENR